MPVKIMFYITVITAFVFCFTIKSTPSILILDMRNDSVLPKNFRTTLDVINKPNINVTGLRLLHMAGGAQYSTQVFERILRRLHAKHITIIDLRQESHGFLNGTAVSWFVPGNGANAHLTNERIEIIQRNLLNGLNEVPIVTVTHVLSKSVLGTPKLIKKIMFPIHQSFSEAEIASKLHQSYYRLYIQDHSLPDDAEVDRFVKIMTSLPTHKWIYIHCRAGQGRTTMFMVMYDMLQNAKNVSFDDILARQAALGGQNYTDVSKFSINKYLIRKIRLRFLSKFYNYVYNNKDSFKTKWSDSHASQMFNE